MGVKDLNPFLREKTPNAIKETLLSEFIGKKVAIDTSIYFYKFLYKNDRFLEGFFQQIFRLRTNGLIPIYIFDGAPPPEKNNTLQQRKDKKTEIINSISTLEEQKKQDNLSLECKFKLTFEINKLRKKLICVTKNNITDLKAMLDLMGIQYIQSDGEADLVCGSLCKHNIVDMVLSDDMDLLTSGATIVLRNFFVSSNKILCYDLNKILEILEINREQWVDFCILCGCDYCDRIQGLGPKNAIKIVKSIISENYNETDFINSIKSKYPVSDLWLDNYKKSKSIFNKTMDLTFSCNDINHPGFSNIESLINILNLNTHLSEKQILNRINVIYKKNVINI